MTAPSNPPYPYPEADLSPVSRYSVKERLSKVSSNSFGSLSPKGSSFLDFIDTLPDILQGKNLRKLLSNLCQARQQGCPIIWMMGGHVIKVGLAPVLNQLIEHGWVQGIVTNSAASIHDSEIARFGSTSEDVAEAIADGSFGMARETSVDYLSALTKGVEEGLGWGESIAKWLHEEYTDSSAHSLFATCFTHSVPVMVHGALGTDIIWQHPELDGAVLGKAGERDFRKLVHLLQKLQGGAILNWGSAVILPEVFLKAFTTARNLGSELKKFTSANFDMIQHYRPRVNILERPTAQGGESFAFTGHHELLMPLIAQYLIEKS